MQWLESDLVAMGLMHGAIEFRQREHIQTTTTSKEMWDKLYQLHVIQWQDTNIHYYLQELYLKKWDECISMSDHIGSFLNLKCRITEAGHKLDDILVIHAILHSLPHSNIWDIVKQNLLDKGKVLILDLLSAELIFVHDHAKRDRQANKNEKKSKSNQILLLAKSAPLPNYSGRRGRRGGRPNNRSRRPRNHPTSTRCYICNQEGHRALECPTNKLSSKSYKGETYQSGDSANLAVDHLQSLGEHEVGKMLMATYDPFPTTRILLNCSIIAHMFTNKQHFSTYVNSVNEFVTVGGHNHVPVAGRGSIHFSAILSNGHLNITLHEVLHIPYLGTNLISLGALHHQGVSVKSSDDSLVLSRGGEELFWAFLTGPTGTLYYIQCTSLESGIAYLASNPLSMRLWHHRLGHLSPRTISSMLHQWMVKGLNITAPWDFDHLCSGCANGKSHRLSFPKASQNKYSKMELVVMDLTGPMLVPTWDGFLYALVIIVSE